MKNGFLTLLVSLLFLPMALTQDCQVQIVRANTTNGIVLELNLKPADQVRGIYWSTGDSTNRIVVSSPGEYCVKVSFSNGCTAEDCQMIDRPDSVDCKVEIKREVTDEGIKLIAIPRPEDAVASIKWSTGADGRSILVREPGKYCVGVRFTTGCVAEACVEIYRPDSVDCKVEIKREVTDEGIKLIAIPRPQDAVASIKWSTGADGRSILVREPGKYCVGVRFTTGCVAEACVEIDRPDSVDCKVEIKREVTDEGIKLIAVPRPENAVASIKWSTGAEGRSILVREPGKYCVGVRFTTGCVAEAWVEIYRPDSVDCKVEIKREVTDEGIKLIAIPRPEDAVASIKWSTGTEGRSILVREPGKYCVGVRFTTGCVAEACVEIDRPDSVDCKVEIKREVTDEGIKLIAIPRPEDAVASIKWSTGTDGRSILVREPGKYCVGVRFTTGCVTEACVEIDRPGCQVSFKREQRDSGLYVSIVPRPDTGVVAIKWNTGDTTPTIPILESGKYCVRIAFRNGCVAENCFEIGEPCSVHIRTAKGKLGAKARGVPPFRYHWSTGDSTEIVEVDAAGEYCVTITDAMGCKSGACVKYDPETLQAVAWDAQVYSSQKETPNQPEILSEAVLFNGNLPLESPVVYPNPSSGVWNVQLVVNQHGTFIVQVRDMQGKVHVQKLLTLDIGNQTIEVDGSSLPPGLYLTTIQNDTRRWAVKTIRR